MEFLNRLKIIFLGLTVQQRFLFLVVLGLAIGAVSYLSFPIKGGHLVPLYSQLHSDDAARVVEALKKDGVQYRLSNGGRTVQVPAEQVHDLRLSLSMEGLPRGQGNGLEIFDKTNIGTSEFVLQVNYQRALQGELSRTISKLDAVEDAKVHLVFPESSPFFEDTQNASASIVLRLQPGAVLEKEQVYGIVHLSAHAVKGLSPDNVSILDTQGNLLAGGQEIKGVRANRDQFLKNQKEMEAYLEKRAESLLGRIEKKMEKKMKDNQPMGKAKDQKIWTMDWALRGGVMAVILSVIVILFIRLLKIMKSSASVSPPQQKTGYTTDAGSETEVLSEEEKGTLAAQDKAHDFSVIKSEIARVAKTNPNEMAQFMSKVILKK